ncbi:MAG: SMC-Scp complex subunit ScpB, partial [Patescibacteria group bacterium]
MPQSNLQAKLEALLFVYGEPVKLKTLSEKLGVTDGVAEAALQALRIELQSDTRGLAMFSSEDRHSLVTKPEFSEIIQK